MASIYARGNRLWCKLKHADGKWRAKRTLHVVGEEKQAQRYADEAQRRIDGKAAAGLDATLTVEAYAGPWLKGRREKYEATSARYERTGTGKIQHRGHRGDESMMRLHILPHIGAMPIAGVLPIHLIEWVHALRTGGTLGPASIRNVYGLAVTMFRDAAIAGRIAASPCILKEDHLGELDDGEGAGRYTREQFELMIGAADLAEHSRIYVALGGLGGLRLGAIAGLRWGDLDAAAEPLWRLTSTRVYKGGPTKTQRPSVVPVHPVLQAMLTSWRHGWGRMFGRPPTANDPIVPRLPNSWQSNPVPMRKRHAAALMAEILDQLEIPPAPMPSHALRSTFISIALEDGAQRELIRRITHSPANSRDAFARYDRADYWPQLCAEVAKLRISPRSGGSVTSLVTSHVTSRGRDRNHMWKHKVAPGSVHKPSGQISHIVPASARNDSGHPAAAGRDRGSAVTRLVQSIGEAVRVVDVERILELADQLRAAAGPGVAARGSR